MKRGLVFSWPVDATILIMLAAKLTGVLTWPWWRVTLPLWGGLSLIVGSWLGWNLLRGLARMALGGR